MGEFEEVSLNLSELEFEFSEFQVLIDANDELSESSGIQEFLYPRGADGRRLPKFQLIRAAAMALGLTNPSHVAVERKVGSYTADLVVVDSISSTALFIELEEAKRGSLFRPKDGEGGTGTIWSPTLERGFSQLVDWLCYLEQIRNTIEISRCINVPGTEGSEIKCRGALVIGRDKFVFSELDSNRLRWQNERVVVNSFPVPILTYDTVCAYVDRYLFEQRRAR